MIERKNPQDLLVAYNELKLKLSKLDGNGRKLTKRILADYLWIKVSILYNPVLYSDLLYIAKIIMVIENIKLPHLKWFVDNYVPFKSTYNAYKQFLSNHEHSLTPKEPSEELLNESEWDDTEESEMRDTEMS